MHLNFDYIILLNGQSNALGIGGVYDPFSNEDQPDPRIWGYVSGHDYWTIFDLRLQIGSKKTRQSVYGISLCKKTFTR